MRAVKDGLGQSRHMAGWRRDLPDHRDRLAPRVGLLAALAQPLAARVQVMDLVPVYDQGGLGSCAANMGCAQVKHLLARAGKLGTFEPSRQDLYKSVRITEQTPLTEDSGAQIRDIFQALRVYGVAPEAMDPYADTPESYSRPRSDLARAAAMDHQAILYYRCPSVRSIKASILQGFPIGFGFTCFESLMSAETARSGLVKMPAKGEASVGGHANLIIGYDDRMVIGSAVGAFLSRNSWGHGWGLGGDLWLPYAYFTTGLADDAWTLRLEEMS